MEMYERVRGGEVYSKCGSREGRKGGRMSGLQFLCCNPTNADNTNIPNSPSGLNIAHTSNSPNNPNVCTYTLTHTCVSFKIPCQKFHQY